MIRIVTDSSCDLPDDVIAQHRIEVVPLSVRFGEEELLDREELSTEEFWRRLTTARVLPETAAAPVGRFQEAFARVVSAGADGIVVVILSAKVSATIQSATLAAEQFTAGIPVRVVDSGLVSTALGLAVIEAAKVAAAGASIEQVEAAARSACERGRIFATPATLEYLRRGGRIGGAAALIGGLLDVKVLIGFEEGKVAGVGRVRSRTRALSAILEHVAGQRGSIRHLAVVHSDPVELPEFLQHLTAIYEGEVMVARIGPAVGTHIGPGAVGVAYLVD
ncbi:MAG TPA: DegV family protein [Acidimicrobiia bacterium]|nr:DegV family protein [Acidimicrobiia bacterium]